jgi:hypothetical protein
LPKSITTDGINLYVVDHNAVRKVIIAIGAVAMIAGVAGEDSVFSIDGTGKAASFHDPSGITTNGTNLYVVECVNRTIRMIQ